VSRAGKEEAAVQDRAQQDVEGAQAEQSPDSADTAIPVESSSDDTPPTAAAEADAAAARREAQEYRDLLQRERADFINYRRRVEAERTALAAQARADALIPFLPIVDDLERAARDVPDELREQPWAAGVLLIAGKLAAALSAAGLERIEALGQEFDPRAHEAFMYEPNQEIPAGHVSTVMRPGYRVGDRVIRPAQVAVSQGPLSAE
jgi:molecular chaperone GrpE